MAEFNSLDEKENKIEDLLQAIVNCRCGTVDCNEYMDSSMEFMDSSIKIFEKIRDDYNLESFGGIVETWTQEKAAAEKHWPDLIKNSERYGIKKCYNIDKDYAKYLNDLDKIDVMIEGDVIDDVSEEWTISLMNLADKMEEKAHDVDDVYEDLKNA